MLPYPTLPMVLRHGHLSVLLRKSAWQRARACRQTHPGHALHLYKTSSCGDSSAYQSNQEVVTSSHGEEEQHASPSPSLYGAWCGPCSEQVDRHQDFKATSTTAVPVPETMAEMVEEEERYVQVASRFFRVKHRGAGAVASLHYLGSCFLCKESIACNRDVFMYKGDAAFCSDDCRQEQMDMDEALEAVARRHRRLLHAPSSSPASSEAAAASSSRPPVMRRRPTIANLAPRNHPVAAS